MGGFGYGVGVGGGVGGGEGVRWRVWGWWKGVVAGKAKEINVIFFLSMI